MQAIQFPAGVARDCSEWFTARRLATGVQLAIGVISCTLGVFVRGDLYAQSPEANSHVSPRDEASEFGTVRADLKVFPEAPPDVDSSLSPYFFVRAVGPSVKRAATKRRRTCEAARRSPDSPPAPKAERRERRVQFVQQAMHKPPIAGLRRLPTWMLEIAPVADQAEGFQRLGCFDSLDAVREYCRRYLPAIDTDHLPASLRITVLDEFITANRPSLPSFDRLWQDTLLGFPHDIRDAIHATMAPDADSELARQPSIRESYEHARTAVQSLFEDSASVDPNDIQQANLLIDAYNELLAQAASDRVRGPLFAAIPRLAPVDRVLLDQAARWIRGWREQDRLVDVRQHLDDQFLWLSSERAALINQRVALADELAANSDGAAPLVSTIGGEPRIPDDSPEVDSVSVSSRSPSLKQRFQRYRERLSSYQQDVYAFKIDLNHHKRQAATLAAVGYRPGWR